MTESGKSFLNLFYTLHRSNTLLDVVKAMLYLLEHPNFESRNNDFAFVLNPSHVLLYTTDLLAGLYVSEARFGPNTAWCEWAIGKGLLRVDECGEYHKVRDVWMEITAARTRIEVGSLNF